MGEADDRGPQGLRVHRRPREHHDLPNHLERLVWAVAGS